MRNIIVQTAATTWKEFLLLFRDRAGLLVLFLMPSALVVIVTLVQENVMELTGEKVSEVLFLNQDNGTVGENLRKALVESGRVELVVLDDAEGSRQRAKSLVAEGKYQVCVVVPAGISAGLSRRVDSLFEVGGGNASPPAAKEDPLAGLQVYFDPGILPGFRSGILAVLQMAMVTVEMDMKIEAFARNTAKVMKPFRPYLGGKTPQPELGVDNLRKSLLTIDDQAVGTNPAAEIHSAVQYNIPAWSLFALFFTAIPLAGSLLLERNSGIWQRLMAMPVSTGNILVGKIMSYVAVCFCQILLIALIGRFVFPLLGLPAFSIAGHLAPLLVIALCAGLAACGYGVLLGSYCSSFEQAAMFGSISIVIAAALGGTMVPVYAMPRIMQRISEISPLNWGLQAFQDVLVRNGSLFDTSGDLARLLLFFLVTLVISRRVSRRLR